ncbi:TetR/AcrR family transcriptional regulator [Nocardioides sp. SYSU DS0651]|uniref:TetR/AcrR family transcriptional regulator n=1 Tax=Nocardioides sp. SYSU DS0651 TaxID=3415955 RepID=UPI003F4C9DA7
MAVQSGVYRGVSAEDRVASRRARLLEATLSVWADPAARTTMTAVCAEAGLTERYFYESFRTLEEAQRAVLDAVAAEIEERTLAAAAAAGTDPVERAGALIATFIDLLRDDPRKGRVAIVEAGAMPALRERRTELLRHFAGLLTDEAHEMRGLPRRDQHTEELAGLFFVGGMAELVTAWIEGALEFTPEEILDVAIRSFLGLYG